MALKKVLILLAWTLFGGTSHGASCGGEGPQPFLNLTLASKVKKLGSVGEVQDFVFWESSNTILYRNESDEVRLSSLNTGTDRPLLPSRYPLSRVVDPGERFLLAHGAPLVLDTFDPTQWDPFWNNWVPPRPLHWNHGELRLTRMERTTLFHPWRVVIWDYNPEVDRGPRFRCEYTMGHDAWNYVQGSEAPYVYLYNVDEKHGDNYLNYYRLNTEDCSVVTVGTPSEPLPGSIDRVYRFPNADALVAEVDHPSLNVRWQQGNRCRYHDIGQQEPLFFSNEHPVVATWDARQGMVLYNLETQRKVHAVDASELKHVGERDLWLTRSDARLLFSPQGPVDGRRLLLELEIDPLVPAR